MGVGIDIGKYRAQEGVITLVELFAQRVEVGPWIDLRMHADSLGWF